MPKGFASLQSPWAHTLKASLPCLPLPLHRILSSSHPLQKDNNPSPRTTTLASLVKGRWIDGKAQTVALLHFYLRYIHLLDLSNLSPSRRRDCHTTLRSAPHSCHMNALPVSHPSETLGVQLRASMPVPCQRELDYDKAISYYKLQHFAISSTLIFAQPYLSQD